MPRSVLFLCLLLTMATSLSLAEEYPVDEGCAVSAKLLSTFGDKSLAKVAAGTLDYDVRHYRLDLWVDPDSRTFGGEVEIHFASLLPDNQRLVLDVLGPTVTAVHHLSGPLVWTQAGDSLVIELPGLKLAAQDSVVVEFNHTLGDGPHGLAMIAWDDNDDDYVEPGFGIASLSQPEHAREWWPCKDRPGDKATAQIAVKVPVELTAISNGTLRNIDHHDDGTNTWRWATDHDIASYLISVAISTYDDWTESCTMALTDPVTIQNWVFPHDFADAQIGFGRTCRMLQFLEDIAGPYVFADEKYSHVEYMNTPNGAMEHQTATSYGSNLIRDDDVKDWIVVHELAHQWFGNSLTPASWKDIWLNEGFATYFEALWHEQEYGWNSEGDVDGYWEYMFWRRLSGLRWEGRSPVYDPFPDILDRVVYNKGAWILHQLRGRMRLTTGNDDQFFALLEEWATGSGRTEGVVTTQEFIDLAGSFAGEDLNDFMWPYLQETVVPHLSLEWAKAEGSFGPDTALQVRLHDHGGVAFDNIYPLKITAEDGIHWRSITLSGAETATSFDLPSKVLNVELDPELWLVWILENETEAPPVKITNASPNPSPDGIVRLMIHLDESTDLTLNVYDLRGRLVSQKNLGTMQGDLFEDQEVLWSGRGSDGRLLMSGVYWFELVGGGHRALRKFSILR